MNKTNFLINTQKRQNMVFIFSISLFIHIIDFSMFPKSDIEIVGLKTNGSEWKTTISSLEKEISVRTIWISIVSFKHNFHITVN